MWNGRFRGRRSIRCGYILSLKRDSRVILLWLATQELPNALEWFCERYAEPQEKSFLSGFWACHFLLKFLSRNASKSHFFCRGVELRFCGGCLLGSPTQFHWRLQLDRCKTHWIASARFRCACARKRFVICNPYRSCKRGCPRLPFFTEVSRESWACFLGRRKTALEWLASKLLDCAFDLLGSASAAQWRRFGGGCSERMSPRSYTLIC